MEQDTGKNRKNTKDQYYTKEGVARKCVDTLLSKYSGLAYEWVEPSAGNGVFLRCLPTTFDKKGIDLDPKDPMIERGNFLTWLPEGGKKRIFFGNPPFGRQSSLAKAFIQHAAKYGDIIAFILPRSFVKPSMSRAFPLSFHCVHSIDLEKNAFQVNTVEYDVPCVFQIWEKRSIPRVLESAEGEKGFQYVKPDEPYHIACKRVGGRAGMCSVAGAFNPSYHYFLKLDHRYIPHIGRILGEVNSHTFPTNTVGPRSLSKGEINIVLNRIIASI